MRRGGAGGKILEHGPSETMQRSTPVGTPFPEVRPRPKLGHLVLQLQEKEINFS